MTWNAFTERWQNFTPEQKISVGILSVCGLLAIGLSLYQLHQSIRDPFLSNTAEVLAFKQTLAPTSDQVEAKQKRTDTDGDGLSDWDEVNVYHTNPNLRDSCGDGMPDNVRVTTGKNINCTDKTGGRSGAIDTSAVDATSSQLFGNQVSASADNSSIISGFAQAALQAQAASGSTSTAGIDASAGFIPRDPKAIRAALAGNVDQATLDSITDAQLLDYYDQAVAQQKAASAASLETDHASSTNP